MVFYIVLFDLLVVKAFFLATDPKVRGSNPCRRTIFLPKNLQFSCSKGIWVLTECSSQIITEVTAVKAKLDDKGLAVSFVLQRKKLT